MAAVAVTAVPDSVMDWTAMAIRDVVREVPSLADHLS